MGIYAFLRRLSCLRTIHISYARAFFHLLPQIHASIPIGVPLVYGVRVCDLFINNNKKSQSTAVQTIFCIFKFRFNGRTLKSGVTVDFYAYVFARLPMDIIIYANVQILHNVERNERRKKKLLVNGQW